MNVIVLSSTLLAVWGMLSVLGAERQRKQLELAAERAKAEAEAAEAARKSAVESTPSH